MLGARMLPGARRLFGGVRGGSCTDAAGSLSCACKRAISRLSSACLCASSFLFSITEFIVYELTRERSQMQPWVMLDLGCVWTDNVRRLSRGARYLPLLILNQKRKFIPPMSE